MWERGGGGIEGYKEAYDVMRRYYRLATTYKEESLTLILTIGCCWSIINWLEGNKEEREGDSTTQCTNRL